MSDVKDWQVIKGDKAVMLWGVNGNVAAAQVGSSMWTDETGTWFQETGKEPVRLAAPLNPPK